MCTTGEGLLPDDNNTGNEGNNEGGTPNINANDGNDNNNGDNEEEDPPRPKPLTGSLGI